MMRDFGQVREVLRGFARIKFGWAGKRAYVSPATQAYSGVSLKKGDWVEVMWQEEKDETDTKALVEVLEVKLCDRKKV